MISVGRPDVDIDPNELFAEAPFKTKRDSCERDRFAGMLLFDEEREKENTENFVFLIFETKEK